MNSTHRLGRYSSTPDRTDAFKQNNTALPKPKDYNSAMKFILRFDIESNRKSSRTHNKSAEKEPVVIPRMTKRPSAPIVQQFGDLSEGLPQEKSSQRIIDSLAWPGPNKTIQEEVTRSSLVDSRNSTRENLKKKLNFSVFDKAKSQLHSDRNNKPPLKLYRIDSPTSAAKNNPGEYEEYRPSKNAAIQANFTHFKKSSSVPSLLGNEEKPDSALTLARSFQANSTAQKIRDSTRQTSHRKNRSLDHSQRSFLSKDFGKKQPDDIDSALMKSKIIERTLYQSNLNFSVNYEAFLIRKYKIAQTNAAVNADLGINRFNSLGLSTYQTRKKLGLLDYRSMNSKDFEKLLQFSNELKIKDVLAGTERQPFSNELEIQQFLESRKEQQAELEKQLKKVNRSKSVSKVQKQSNEVVSVVSARRLIGLHPASKALEVKNRKAAQVEYCDVLGRENQKSVQCSFRSKNDENQEVAEAKSVGGSNRSSPNSRQMIRDFKKSIREVSSKPSDQEVPSIHSYQLFNKSKESRNITNENDALPTEYQLNMSEIDHAEEKTIPIRKRKQL